MKRKRKMKRMRRRMTKNVRSLRTTSSAINLDTARLTPRQAKRSLPQPLPSRASRKKSQVWREVTSEPSYAKPRASRSTPGKPSLRPGRKESKSTFGTYSRSLLVPRGRKYPAVVLSRKTFGKA